MAVSMSEAKLAPETLAAHAVFGADPTTGAVAPPLHPAVTYARDSDYRLRDPAQNYGRNGSPTVVLAERVITALEEAAATRLFSSGMAAIATLFETVPHGSHVAAPQVMYYGTRHLLQQLEGKGRIGLTLFDPEEPEGLRRAVVKGRTDILWIETPINPTLGIIDIAQAAEIAHQAGAVLAVDSTAASPVLTRPLALGADVVFHSATKYLNGHSDVLAGVLATREESERWQAIAVHRTAVGNVLGAMEAWMLTRGMRTLHLRVRRSCDNAMAVAQHLAGHPQVERVLYPGLPDHPGHAIARRQMSAFGGMLSMLVRGDLERANRVVRRLKVFLPATSLGGVESLAEHRRIIEGPDSPVPENLVRLSIGIEAVEDLIDDLDQALAG
jgi:cystathionine gamma-synthase